MDPSLCWCHDPPPMERQKRWASTAALVDPREWRDVDWRLDATNCPESSHIRGLCPPPPPPHHHHRPHRNCSLTSPHRSILLVGVGLAVVCIAVVVRRLAELNRAMGCMGLMNIAEAQAGVCARAPPRARVCVRAHGQAFGASGPSGRRSWAGKWTGVRCTRLRSTDGFCRRALSPRPVACTPFLLHHGSVTEPWGITKAGPCPCHTVCKSLFAQQTTAKR